ncbi:MAG: carbon-nitrogen hydrolase family protein [Nitrospira sp.]|jgi:predicted amidohydrolase|nr:carbon-nitrogen hydrolase family protein [Nitrospira sp.]MDH4244266.1 carbon-nitrogen hydrolase family protein [Nitrospira sp.]MDH4355600.1 carbon-nitrogen hydrolase family protein [Nitrospira sp.]MDH5318092.1 carbon-nitrogen hydrolase family protein [Nitrospira sp.]
MSVSKVALLHLETVPGAVEQNRYVIVEAIKHAASVGAEWIVTPELAVCGLQFVQLIGTDWIEPQPDPWMQQVCRLVKRLKRTVFLSCPERDGRRLYNTVFVIDSAGEVVGKHRKINVASDSLSWSSPGDVALPIECSGIKVGVLVCADVYTQNIARAMKFEGAQMLLSPASWGPGLHGPNGEWEQRTYETGLPLIVCNRTGAEKTLDFWDAPSLVVKDGVRVLTHTSKKSAVLTFNWDFDRMVLRSSRYFIDYMRN